MILAGILMVSKKSRQATVNEKEEATVDAKAKTIA